MGDRYVTNNEKVYETQAAKSKTINRGIGLVTTTTSIFNKTFDC
jgi:hypothetical protein